MVLETPGRTVAEETRNRAGAIVTTDVPKANCGPGDRIETGLQGQVPVFDRISGRAADGYNCNLDLIGGFGPGTVDPAHLATGVWWNFDTYQDCAYYSDTHRGDQFIGQYAGVGEKGGTVVLDVSDPSDPKKTDYLTAPAMQQPNESLRVNAKRGLLVANRDDQPSGESHAFAVYDVSHDCAHPKLLFAGDMPQAFGHEGYFAPDGRTYYMTDGGRYTPPEASPGNLKTDLYAIDLSDPLEPKEIGPLSYEGMTALHGGSTSLDGKRLYQCDLGTGTVAVLDASSVQARRSAPSVSLLSNAALPNNGWCQATYPLEYDGHPYMVQFGESTAVRCPDTEEQNLPNFDVPRIIDLADERSPQLVAELRLEVDQPENCPAVMADASPRSVEFTPLGGGPALGFIYDVHHCSPDRLIDPTILACEQFEAGLRVYDIRDPEQPKELAYYNTGTLSTSDSTVDDALSRPVVRTDLGQIWFTTEWGGFHVAQFRPGVWPFAGEKCGKRRDYFWRHYNPNSPCLRAPRSN